MKEITIGETTFAHGGPDPDLCRKAFEYLGTLWRKLPYNLDQFSIGLSGGLTDRDFRKGCEFAKKAKGLGYGPPKPATFRLWMQGINEPKRRASPAQSRAAIERLRERTRGL